MRPAHVFAKPPADGELQIVALLQGPWRVALRSMMIWLSLRGLSASEIAALFEYDPRTVRRWIDRYNREGVARLEDRPRSGAPRLGGAGLGRRIGRGLIKTVFHALQRVFIVSALVGAES